MPQPVPKPVHRACRGTPPQRSNPIRSTQKDRSLQRFILTGAPGSGKTALLRSLEADGYTVVEEAATDIIALDQARGVAEPWNEPSFPDRICRLQHARQTTASTRPDTVQFYDRSPICTLALARHLRHPVLPALKSELDRIEAERVYQRRVFFVELLGFITPSAARRIGLDEAIEFEALHHRTYRELGYDCVPIPPGTLPERAETIKRLIGGPDSTHLRDSPQAVKQFLGRHSSAPPHSASRLRSSASPGPHRRPSAAPASIPGGNHRKQAR